MISEACIVDRFGYYTRYVMKKYKWDYETAHDIVVDCYCYYKERNRENEFVEWGLHRCNQLALNYIRDSKPGNLPLDYEDDDGEIKQAWYITGYDGTGEFDWIDVKESLPKTLNDYEMSIVELLYLGFTQKEIAATKGVSKQAVNNTIKSIKYKLTFD